MVSSDIVWPVVFPILRFSFFVRSRYINILLQQLWWVIMSRRAILTCRTKAVWPLKRRLQLYDSTAIRPPFDCSETEPGSFDHLLYDRKYCGPELTMGHILWPMTHVTHQSIDPWPVTHDYSPLQSLSQRDACVGYSREREGNIDMRFRFHTAPTPPPMGTINLVLVIFLH